LPRGAPSSARLRTTPALRLGHRGAGIEHLFTLVVPKDREGQAPVHASRCPRDRASLSLGASCRLLQPETTHGHTRRGPDPRARVGRMPRYTPAPTDADCVGLLGASPHREPASHAPAYGELAHAALRSGRIADDGPKRRRKGESRVANDSRVPFSRRVGHPGHRLEPSRGLDSPRCTDPAETHLGCSLAKGNTVGRIEVPSTGTESLRDRRMTPPCAPGPRPRHAASVEALLGGSRAFITASVPPPSDEASGGAGSPG